MLGDHCIKTWSSTQGAVALSVCEAEYYALVEGASRVKGIAAMAKELGIEAEVEVMDALTDSSSAKSFASRRGAGRIRHIEVRWLWLQDEVAKGRVRSLHREVPQQPLLGLDAVPLLVIISQIQQL